MKITPSAVAQVLPVPAREYKGSVEQSHWVRDADLETYTRTCAGVGAASLALASHVLMLGAGAWAGSTLGSTIGGPIGSLVGGAAGAYCAFKLQSKTLIGRRLGGRAGAVLGALAAPMVKAAGIPLRSNQVQETRNFSYGEMVKKLGSIDSTSHPHISAAEADAFIAQLQPGDIVLANDEAATIFSVLCAAVDSKADFNHALLYIGNGKTIESRTVTEGVAEGDMKSVLMKKHHAISIRPRYQTGQAQAVVDAARAMIGVPYDYKFRMGNEAMYCSELVQKAVKAGAPQVTFDRWSVIGREVILPGDFVRTDQADVVAEAGVDRTLFDSYLGKFT